jgi:hypothetical protein
MSRTLLLAALLNLTACFPALPEGERNDTSEGPDLDEDGYAASEGDCNESNPDIYPGATEICDGIDNDCDGRLDDGDEVLGETLGVFFLDADGDGYGAVSSPKPSCAIPAGYAAEAGDCDDQDATIHPEADESCNGQDDDCDLLVDDADEVDSSLLTVFHPDADGDGFGDPAASILACSEQAGYTSDDRDCDDTRNDVNPAATEICDGVDDDCDVSVDDADASVDANSFSTWYRDADLDGFGATDDQVEACAAPSSTYVAEDGDCDDEASAVGPGAPEICDGMDNDCNGLTDSDDPGLDPSALGSWYLDADGDGYGRADFIIEWVRIRSDDTHPERFQQLVVCLT